MFLIVSVQLLVPLLLIALLATGRGTARTLLPRLAVVTLYLFAIHALGLWTRVPGWTPWVLAALALGAAARARSRAGAARLPRAVQRIADPAVFVVVAAIGLWGGAEAILARRPPPAAVVDLAWPLVAGVYAVANGGSRLIANAHLKTLDTRVARYATWRGQSYALDIVGVDSWGRVSDGLWPADPARYAIFGRRVLAPCDGRVVASGNDAPDMPVPRLDPDRRLGNYVILECGDAHVLLAHLRQGSVTAAAGDRVRTGDVLGVVGNSGNSDEPHLHIHVQRPGTPDAPIAAEPLALRLAGRFPVRNDILRVPTSALPRQD